MPKRLTDTDIWKKQRWFRKLEPEYKLVWKYIKDECDHSGIWRVDCSDLLEDLGIEAFDLHEFIKKCNVEFDKMNGSTKRKERVRLLDNSFLWITGFIQFQYENKEKVIPIHAWAVKSAIQRLNGLGILDEAIEKGYITLSEGLPKGYLTVIAGFNKN